MKKIMSMFAVAILLSACSVVGEWKNVFPEKEFLIIAHRGASDYEPENTLPSFELAEGMNADYIELDIHMTKDGQLVVMHDKDVKRTTEAVGKIKDYTLDELKQLTAVEQKGGKKKLGAKEEKEYKIPTLSEVIEEMQNDIHFVIELKNTKEYIGIETKLVNIMKDYDLIGADENGYPKAVIHSFDEKALKQVHKLDSTIPLLQLISFDKGEEAKVSKQQLKKLLTYASGIGVSYEAITPSFVNTMKGKNLAVFAYTVNDAESALHLKAMGVNGIHTNKPDLLDE